MTGLRVPLLSQPVLVLRRRPPASDAGVGFDVLDQRGELLGVVQQVHASPLGTVGRRRPALAAALPAMLEVREGAETVLRLRKPWFSGVHEVAGAGGEHLGTIRPRARPCGAVLEVLDTTGRLVGLARPDGSDRTRIDVVDNAGHPSGRVTTRRAASVPPGSGPEVDLVTVERPTGLVDPLQTLIVAVPFLLAARCG